MDDGRFDALTRVLGAARTRRGAIGVLAALFGGAAVAAAEDAGSSKKHHHRHHHKKRCNPKCPAGQKCDRTSRTCFCQNGGTVCGANCCPTGQACEGGQCVAPGPEPTCHAFGAECAGDNIPCCGSDLQCASGQGGKFDVACYKKADVACTADSECVYGTRCTGGKCTLIQPPICDGVTCPNGCCSGRTCVPFSGQSGAVCGIAGRSCASCGAGTDCVSGVCTAVCNANTCPNGCCDGIYCVPFIDQDEDFCGIGGAICGTCASGTGCFSGACAACDATTCPDGCCDGVYCLPVGDQDDDFCGTGVPGAACRSCLPGGACSGGTCVS